MTKEVPIIALANVEVAAAAIISEKKRLEHELFIAIVEARLAGATWAEIGHTLGCSRQAAWERFHYKVHLYLKEAKN